MRTLKTVILLVLVMGVTVYGQGGTKYSGRFEQVVLRTLSGLDNRMASMENRMLVLETTLAMFMKEVYSRFDQVGKRFEQVDKRFDQVDKRFEQVDKRFEQVDRRLEQIDRRFEQVDKRFEQMASQFFNYIIILIMAFGGIAGATIAFALWDRRQTLRPFEKRVKKIEKKIEEDDDLDCKIVSLLREYSRKNARFARLAKQFNLI